MPRVSQFTAMEIFIDTNIFIYDINDNPQFGKASHELIAKIEKGQIEGYTPHLVISEIIHKMMLSETCHRFDLPLPQAVSYLKRNPHVISTLHLYQEVLEIISHLGNLTILEVDNAVFKHSQSLIREYQLLSTDAIHAATCLAYNLRHLATNDKDFKRVKELTIWSP